MTHPRRPAAIRAATGAATAARVASGSIRRTSPGRTPRAACGRVAGTTRPAWVSTTVARAARSWSASQVAGSKAAAVGEERAHRAHDLGRLVEAAQELVDVHAGGRLERLPAAVDEDEPGAAVAEGRRGRGSDDRAEAVAGQDVASSPSASSPDPSATARTSLGQDAEVVGAVLGRGVGQAVAAQVHRDRADGRRSRRATGAQTSRSATARG